MNHDVLGHALRFLGHALRFLGYVTNASFTMFPILRRK